MVATGNPVAHAPCNRRALVSPGVRDGYAWESRPRLRSSGEFPVGGFDECGREVSESFHRSAR
jgi:hypothetical protein